MTKQKQLAENTAIIDIKDRGAVSHTTSFDEETYKNAFHPSGLCVVAGVLSNGDRITATTGYIL